MREKQGLGDILYMEVILRGGLNWNFDKIGTEVRDDVIGGKGDGGKLRFLKLKLE